MSGLFGIPPDVENDILFRILFDDQAYTWAFVNSKLRQLSGGEPFTEKEMEETMAAWREVTRERIAIMLRIEKGETDEKT